LLFRPVRHGFGPLTWSAWWCRGRTSGGSCRSLFPGNPGGPADFTGSLTFCPMRMFLHSGLAMLFRFSVFSKNELW